MTAWSSDLLVLDLVDNCTFDGGHTLHNDFREHLHQDLKLEQQRDLPLLCRWRMHRHDTKVIHPVIEQEPGAAGLF